MAYKESSAPHRRWPAICLGVAVCLFTLLQWVTQRRIYATVAFGPHRGRDFLETRAFYGAMREQIGRYCDTGIIRTVYFNDFDVTLPEIVNDVTLNPGCQPVRETEITPIDPARIAQCSAIDIEEERLDWGLGLAHATPKSWLSAFSQLSEWSAPSGNFRFQVYRKADCPSLPLPLDKPDKEGQ